MRAINRLSASLAVCAVAAAAMTGCASAPASNAPAGDSLGSTWPAPPEDEVIAQGTVLDAGGEPQLCLGPIAESYPPQCSGVPLAGWTWDGVEGAESSGDVTWGAYAVQGRYDGETFTVTQPPILLALYDPMPIDEPDAGPGTSDEKTLLGIQEQLPDLLGAGYLSSYPQDGRLWVDVVWDDGTWQNAADHEYGEGTVVVRSALRTVDG
jgi:opacity protein-like surface antigen